MSSLTRSLRTTRKPKPMSPRCPSLPDIQKTNTVYSEADQTVINPMKMAEDGIPRLGALRKNTTKRRKLEDQIHRYHIALASFKKVPNEIWMYIFELHCQSDRLSTCHKIQPLVVLTQVCSTWRQIVLSMPILWSDVHIGKKTNLARMWFERAGSIPRAFDATELSHCLKYNRHEEIQKILCSFPFKKLHLTEYDAAEMQFREIPEASLLPVEDLAVMPSIYNATTNVSFNSHPFPNLVSLHIHARRIPRFHASNPFSTWKKLRVLRLECNLSVSEYLDILSDASSVKNCTLLYHYATHFITAHDDRSIEHANLRILTLSFLEFLMIRSLLDCLTCPNLQTLVLISTSLHPWDVPSMLSLARCTGGSLRSLDIHDLYITADIILVLESLPLLQVLALSCERITERMGEKIGKGELGGCLRELHDWNTCNLNKLLRACELRRNITSKNNPAAITRLENVSVRYNKTITDRNVKSRIYKLRRDGIEFKVYQNRN